MALRDGDLAYLHVHPTGDPATGRPRPGPAIDVRRHGALGRGLPAVPGLPARRRGPHDRCVHALDEPSTDERAGTPDDVELADRRHDLRLVRGRIEKKLNRIDGVTATVNYATEKARSTTADGVTTDDLIATVERPATPRRCPPPPTQAGDAATEPDAAASLRRRLLVSAAAQPCRSSLLAMVPALQFDYWQWLSLALAAPVVVWGGWPFHRAALDQPAARRRHDGHADLGRHAGRVRLVAVRAVPRHGRRARHDAPVRAHRRPRRRRGNIYLEVAAGVTMFILAGRYFEARAKRRAGAALRALLDLGAKDVARPARRRREPHPGRRSSRSATCSSSGPGEKIATDGVVERGHLARSTPRCSPASRCRSRSGPGDAVAGATVNAGGRLVVRATRVGADTQLAQMARLVEEAQNGKAEVQRLADRVSAVFVPIVIGARGRHLGFWLGTGAGATAAFTAAVAVLIIACPCALGLATPTALHGRHRPRRPAGHPDQGPARSWSRPAASTPSCSTRPARSPPAG